MSETKSILHKKRKLKIIIFVFLKYFFSLIFIIKMYKITIYTKYYL